jgi:hypothetical protein
VGVGLDSHEAKKRLQEMSTDADRKFAKKAKKFGDSAMANSMMPFVKTGTTVSHESVAPTVSSKSKILLFVR